MDSNSDNKVIMTISNPKGKSVCWKFMFLIDGRDDIVRCILCQAEFRYSYKSTSNLLRHLQGRHPVEYELEKAKTKEAYLASGSGASPMSPKDFEIEPETQGDCHQLASTAITPGPSIVVAKSIKEALKQRCDQTAKHISDSATKKRLDDAVLNFIIKDLQPLSCVEKEGFRELLHTLDPTYEIVPRRRLSSQLLPTKYYQVKTRVIAEMKACDRVSITTDNWTSRANKDAHTTITAHFIDTDWTSLQSRVLLTRSEGKQHTTENLLNALQEACQEYGLTDKLSTIVTDNIRNITSAAVALKIQHQLCFAHTLNLVVSEAIEDIPEISTLVKKVKAIVAYFHNSTVATSRLRAIHQRKASTIKKLKQCVDSRWNSTFDMLQSFVTQSDEVTTVLCLNGKKSLCLDEQDFPAVKDSIDILEPFYEVTEELSLESNSSASKIIPMVKVLTKITGNSDHPLARQLHENLKWRFAGCEGEAHLALATLLDPRFKSSGFTSASAADIAVEELKKVIDVKTTAEEEGESDVKVKEEELDEECEPPPAKMKKPSLLWSDFDFEFSKELEKTNKHLSAAAMEIKQYLDSPGIGRNKDPLAWWKDHSSILPRLEKVAKDVLAIPATSVPSEEIFSKAGELVSARRSNLSKSDVGMLVFLNKNM